MITKMNDLVLYDGKTVYMKRAWVGWVKFMVEIYDGNTMNFESLNHRGYSLDIDLDNSTVVEIWDEELEKNPAFATLEEARQYDQDVAEKNVNQIVEEHKDNKVSFIESMIQNAYRHESNVEYGNPDKAAAIKELARIHYPELDIDPLI